ncbi:Na(+)/H(+) exchange regulatory cofactor NHE-RF1 [Aphelenchoides bicaudatus]|nr:Na(+)/H(+) exchange regulatory cofactor NHE-RF1 [Aphelenchoides bicaudatus]
MVQRSSVPADAPPLRLCLVRKTQHDQEYGFNLHAERNKSQFVGAVDIGSPAERGGLKQGDRILGVNGVLISGESHKEVVQRIKQRPSECELLVIEPEGLRWYEANGFAVDYALPNIIRPVEPINIHLPVRQSIASERRPTQQSLSAVPLNRPVMTPRPLLCLLRKHSPTDEFGFNLHADRGKGHFIGAVDQNGIADRAGLETGQRIVGVNGELIYPTSAHKEVVGLIKRDPLETRLLVASEEIDKWYFDNGIPYSFDLAIVHESARPQPQSRTATVASVASGVVGGHPASVHASRHNSIMISDDAATNAVYVPPELQPEVIGHPVIEETEVETLATAPPDTGSELISELQDVENAAVGVVESEDLLEQVFARVKPPEVEAAELREQNGLVDAVAVERVVAPTIAPALNGGHHPYEHEHKHLITNYNSTPLTVAPPPHVHATGPSHPPPVTYTPASNFGMGSPHSDKRSLDSPDSHKDENIDIFKMNAKEARQAMRQKRKDPRLQTNMTLEEKHHLIANL